MKRVHDYGLKQIGIGLSIIALILVLSACKEQEEKPVMQTEKIVVTPEDSQEEEPKDEGNYTEDGRKLPTLKKKYQ